MGALKTDMSIYKKFNFERPPVGIKYLFHKPEGIKQLDKELALCEMLKEAQERGEPFYFTKENESCFGKSFLGMTGESELADGGLLGVKLEVFQDGRANTALRRQFKHLESGSVNYVAMSPLDKMTFDPDLIVLTGTPSQAEVALRATTYATGDLYESKSTSVGGCIWLYVYPFLSGKVNFTITGLAFGMKGRQVFPEGLMLISIPYQQIPAITRNLNEMKWVPTGYTLDKDEFNKWEKGMVAEVIQEGRNP